MKKFYILKTVHFIQLTPAVFFFGKTMKEVAMPNSDRHDQKVLYEGSIVSCISSKLNRAESRTVVLIPRKGYKDVSVSDLGPCRFLVCISNDSIAQRVKDALEIVNVDVTHHDRPAEVLGDGFFGVVTDDLELARQSVCQGKTRVALIDCPEDGIEKTIHRLDGQDIKLEELEKWITHGSEKADFDRILREEQRRLR